MARRRAIDNPISLYSAISADDEFADRFSAETAIPSQTGMINLDEHIRAHLDESLIPAYEAVASGDASAVPIAVRRRLRRQVEGIIE
jgi:hypothetical protein